jgi:cytoskeletal protein CcmA (bactofilin family)
MAQKEGNGQNKAATTTAIGPTIVIRGKLRSDEDLIVKGRIEAEIQSSKALLVENSGIIKANVRVKSARISGVLVGNITAEERVEIAPDGRMVGDITAPKIIINDGAAFRGRIDMQNFDEASKGEPKVEAAKEADVVKPDAKPEGSHKMPHGQHTPAVHVK